MRNNFLSKLRGRFFSSPGSPKHNLYSSKVMDDGQIKLVVSGCEDTDELIESYRMSTDLKTLINRFKNGDESALHRFEPVYADLSDFPKDYASALQSIINAESAFTALPMSIREQFGNDWRQWIAKTNTDEWFTKMEPVFSKPDEVTPIDVKEEEKME